MKLGIISDTHDFFDPQISQIFAQVDHILHAGDIGNPMILHQLQAFAPVTAVAGNTDEPAFNYPLSRIVELASRKFLLKHIVSPRHPDELLREDMLRLKPDVVVFGHSHKPFCEELDGILFFNPGYAGKTRFGMERTVAVLEVTGQHIRPKYFGLDRTNA